MQRVKSFNSSNLETLKMDTLKFLHYICILFCLFSYYALVKDSHEIFYEKNNEASRLRYLVCKDLQYLCPSKTEINLNEFREVLNGYFNYLIENNLKETNPIKNSILNRSRSGGYLINNGKACLILNQSEFEMLSNFESILYDLTRMNYVSINMETFDFIEIGWDEKVDQSTVLKKGPPYSDCAKNNTRFFCLNDCFKKNFRLARYLYDGSETGIIRLKYSLGNQSLRQSEKNCFQKCKRDNCKLLKLKSKMFIEPHKNETFEARTKLTDSDYWLQLIGLALSFVGLSFKKSKVRRKELRIGLFCLNLCITFFSLAYGA